MYTFLIQVVQVKKSRKGQRHFNLLNGKWESKVMKLEGKTPEDSINRLKTSDVIVDTWQCLGVCA